MKLRSIDITIGLITVALMIAPWLRCVFVSDLKFSARRGACSYAQLYPRPLLADLDGDALLDESELSSTGQYKTIRISLSASRTRSLSFDPGTPDTGRLVSGDIDHDNDQDLVWYSQIDPAKIFFWLNDGKGSFGLATRYQLSDRRTDLDLNSLLSLETDAHLSGQQQNSGTTRALRADDSVAFDLEARREATTRATPIILQSEWGLQS